MSAISHPKARLARRATLLLSLAAMAAPAHAALMLFTSGGDSNPLSIQPTVDAFRAALGEPLNGNASGPLAGGRREINWDGGGAANATLSGSTLTAFTNTRGATFFTPGTSFLQTPLDDPLLLGINPTYGTTFSFFSPLRVFTPVGSNITDVVFSIPGTGGTTPATVGGFGAIFSDVDLPATTLLRLFDADNDLLGTFFAPPAATPTGGLSFLGVLGTAGERIARVSITTGNTALGPNDGGATDVVVMDDFFFSEPQEIIAAVPEPATSLLVGLGLLAPALLRRRGGRARNTETPASRLLPAA